MDKRQRVTLLGVAAAIAVVAVVVALVAGGGSDDEDSKTTSQTTAADTGTTGATTTAPDAPVQAPEKPEPEQIEVQGGEPVDGIQKIEVEKGDRVEIEVTADEADEVHLHGYDVTKEVGPGKTAKFGFKANLEGIYEIELHHHATPIGRLTVKP
jgi:FtsP/CotA-like multicopper oxidase with cupredoxin domain